MHECHRRPHRPDARRGPRTQAAPDAVPGAPHREDSAQRAEHPHPVQAVRVQRPDRAGDRHHAEDRRRQPDAGEGTRGHAAATPQHDDRRQDRHQQHRHDPLVHGHRLGHDRQGALPGDPLGPQRVLVGHHAPADEQRARLVAAVAEPLDDAGQVPGLVGRLLGDGRQPGEHADEGGHRQGQEGGPDRRRRLGRGCGAGCGCGVGGVGRGVGVGRCLGRGCVLGGTAAARPPEPRQRHPGGPRQGGGPQRERRRGIADVGLDEEGRDQGGERERPQVAAEHGPDQEQERPVREHGDVDVPGRRQERRAERAREHGRAEQRGQQQRPAATTPGEHAHRGHRSRVHQHGRDRQGRPVAAEEPVGERQHVEEGGPGVEPPVARVGAERGRVGRRRRA